VSLSDQRGADHEEVKTQEGQVGLRIHENVAKTQTDSREEENPVDDQADGPNILGDGRLACGFPDLGSGARDPQVKRHEGSPATTSRRGFAARIKPLKGEPQECHPPERWRDGEERTKVAERSRKPASGTVVGGVGPAGGHPGTTGEPSRATGADVDSLLPYALKGKRTP
jgi:hypothetical protein